MGIKMKSLLLILSLLVASFSFAIAQNPVVTQPSERTALSTASGTATASFVSVFAANLNRLGCVIQNKGSNNMYVNFVSLATATISNSSMVAPGASAGCTLYGTVITGQVSVRGTAGDDYYAAQY